MTCKDCKYWSKRHVTDINGGCSNDKFVYNDGMVSLQMQEFNDCLVYGDTEMYNAWFQTGPNFGCVHFEDKRGPDPRYILDD